MRNRWLAPVCILAMVIFGLTLYRQLPEQVPSHWNINGQVDRTSGRLQSVLFLPGIAAALLALMLVLPRIDPLRKASATFDHTLQLFINTIILFLAVLYVATLGVALGWPIELPRILLICLGILFVVLGNQMGRLQPNWFVGIRTPWTLADPEVWRRTHRVGGRVFFLAGLAFAIFGMLLPLNLGGYAVLVGTLGTAAFVTLYSYLAWRRKSAS